MKFSELDGKRVALWGFGRETRAFTDQLNRRLPGASIAFVVDENRVSPSVNAELLSRGIDAVSPGDAENLLPSIDVLVRSPGVSIYKPLVRAALAAGKPVTTPTGLWMAQRGATHVIGVTGTKGKSTTATVIAHLLSQTTTPVELAGNIGRAVIDLLDVDPETWVVCELSSYQIADLDTGPEVAVLTNLSREHVDWHGSEAQYRADKLRLFGLPGVRVRVDPTGALSANGPEDRAPGTAPAGATAGAHAGAAAGAPAGAAGPGRAAPGFVGDSADLEHGRWHADAEGNVYRGDELVLSSGQIPLRGAHNARNVATALWAVEAAGLDRPPLPEGLIGLQPLPHRLQTVHTTADGGEWVDDSISTTPESTIAALEAFAGRDVVLLAGGQDRGQELAHLAVVLSERQSKLTLILLPDTGARLEEEALAAGFAASRMSPAGDMREAVALARARLKAGGVVLLSPAAPSYNAYRDFEQRGEDFAALARAVG